MGITTVTYLSGLVRVLVKTCDVHRTVPSTQHPRYMLAAIIVYEAFHMHYLIYSSLTSSDDVAVYIIIISQMKERDPKWLSNITKVTQLESDRAGSRRPAFLLPQGWLFPRQHSCSLGRSTLRPTPAPTHGVGLAAWEKLLCFWR